MNETDTSPICPYKPAWFWKLGEQICFVSYALVLPIFFLVCSFAYSISLRAFFGQLKKESDYSYQLSAVSIKIINVICFALFMLSWLGSGIGMDQYSWEWYKNSYSLMWYVARASLPLVHASSIASLLLSLSMTADRIFALVKPFVYRDSNKKRHHNLALVISLLIAVSSTFYNAFLFDVAEVTQDPAKTQIPPSPRYLIVVDIEYVISLTATILAYLSNAVRVIGLTLLIVLNLIMIKCYQQRLTKVAEITAPGQRADKKLRQQNQKRALMLLTAFQSLFTAVGMFSYVCFYTAAYAVPFFNLCDSKLYAPLLNSVLMICELADACAIILLNEKSKKLCQNLMIKLNVCKGGDNDFVITNATVTVTAAGTENAR